MIGYTLAQAAERVYQPLDVLEAWVSAGWLIAVPNPADGHLYVEEEHLLDVEREVRTNHNGPTPTRPGPRPLPQLRQWLWDHAHPITERTLRNLIAAGTLTPTTPGRRGRGGAALFDPIDALAAVSTLRKRAATR